MRYARWSSKLLSYMTRGAPAIISDARQRVTAETLDCRKIFHHERRRRLRCAKSTQVQILIIKIIIKTRTAVPGMVPGTY